MCVLTGGVSADLINKYRFNGQEWQDELALNLYDMDFRDYDPMMARWLGIDPVTHFSQSPYNAFDGNPVSIADPSGADGYTDMWNANQTYLNNSLGGSWGNTTGTGGFTVSNLMPDSTDAEQVDAAWGDGGLLSINLDWGSLNRNTFLNFTKKSINITSDNLVLLPGVVLPEITLTRGDRSNGLKIQQHVYRNSPYHHAIRDYISNTANAWEKAGDRLALTGYGFTVTGIGAPLGIPLAFLGEAFSIIGGATNVFIVHPMNMYIQGNYEAELLGMGKELFFFGSQKAAEHYLNRSMYIKDLANEIIKQNIGIKLMLIKNYIDKK